MNRRDFLLATTASAVAGCVSVGGSAGPPAPAPVYAVGDRWVYAGRDGFRVPIVWEEIRQVTAVAADGIVFRITQQGPTVSTQRLERLSSPGIVTEGAVFDSETRLFKTPLRRYDFPLTTGASWRQTVQDFDQGLGRDDPLLTYTTVGGWDKVSVPAGTFDAMLLRTYMQLNLDDPFKYPTQCNYLFAWSPAVGATVREHKYATYREKGDMGSAFNFRSQDSTLELVSYQRTAA